MSKAPTSLGEGAPAASGGSFDIFEIVLYGLGRYRWWVVPCVGIGLAVGLVKSLIEPNTFASTGEIFISLGMRESISPESVIGGAAPKIALPDELHVLKSPELFERVARIVGPDRILEPYDPTRYDDEQTPIWTRKLHEFQEWYFNRTKPKGQIDPKSRGQTELAGWTLAKIVTIRVGAMSQVMTVGARAKSPELAQEIVETTMSACRERHREVFADQFNKVFVEEQIEKAKENLENLATEFYQHRTDCGFFDIVKQKNQLFGDLGQIDNAIAGSTIRLAEIKKEREMTEEKLGVLPRKVPEVREPKYEPNPFYVKYQDQLVGFQERINSLSKTYKPESDEYARQKDEIAGDMELAKGLLKDLAPVVKVGDPYTIEVDNPDFKAAEKKLDDLDLEQERLLVNQAREADRRATILKRIDALLLCEPIHQRLQDEIGLTTSQINKFNDASDNAASLALIDQDITMSNLRILDHANFNPRKVAPDRAKSVITGLAGGFGAWAAFALLRQFLDSKVRFPKNLERTLGVKVLGVVPEQRRWKRIGRRIRARFAA